MRTTAARWRLGRLVPGALAGWFLLDLGLRFAPVEHLGVSPIRAAERLAGPHVPFRAGVRIDEPAGGIGQNALTGNLPPTERRGRLHFSTDRLGYRRNPAMPVGAAPELLILGGDSFTYGAQLSDEETLPAALTRHTGLGVYNAGRSHLLPMTLADLDWLLARLPGRPRTVVLVHLEHHDRRRPEPPRQAAPQGWRRLPGVQALRRLRTTVRAGLAERLRFPLRLVATWWTTAPLEDGARRLFRALADDRVLPNVHRDDVYAVTLPDGRPMLFRESELAPARRPRADSTLRQTADYLVWWREQLAARGIDSYVLLLPTRYTIYGPWLETGARRRQALRAARDLHLLAAHLRARDVPTLDALTLLAAAAPADLRSGRLPYFREDNHWRAEGVERIARALADSLAAVNRRTAPPETGWAVPCSRP